MGFVSYSTCGHREQRPVKERVQEKTETPLTRISVGTIQAFSLLMLFFTSHCWHIQKIYTRCTVIITKEKCFEITHMLVAEKNIIKLELTLKYNRALEAGSRKHLSMVAIFIFCMVHIQMFTTTMHLTAIMC